MHTMSYRARDEREFGFTLIELLVVIAIIGILASVVLAALGSTRERARNASYLSQVREYQKALESFFHDNGSYPVTGITASACIGIGHQGARCFGSNSYQETDAYSVAFRNAIDPYIDSNTRMGAPSGTYNGALYSPANAGANYVLRIMFEGADFECPIGVEVVNSNYTNDNKTRCDYTHPL